VTAQRGARASPRTRLNGDHRVFTCCLGARPRRWPSGSKGPGSMLRAPRVTSYDTQNGGKGFLDCGNESLVLE